MVGESIYQSNLLWYVYYFSKTGLSEYAIILAAVLSFGCLAGPVFYEYLVSFFPTQRRITNSFGLFACAGWQIVLLAIKKEEENLVLVIVLVFLISTTMGGPITEVYSQ